MDQKPRPSIRTAMSATGTSHQEINKNKFNFEI